jgi:hypothetical protein
MDADANAERLLFSVIADSPRALQRARCPIEQREHSVACGVDLPPAIPIEEATTRLVVPGQPIAPGRVADSLSLCRRSDKVSHQQRRKYAFVKAHSESRRTALTV